MVGRLVDTLIVFRILKMLTTPFEKHQAYKFGFIDRKGKRIKEVEDENGKMVKNNPFTTKEKSSLTPLHRIVFNLKKIIEKVPFGKSQFASYVVALALLKEECELDETQADELCEKFYRWLKEHGRFTPDLISESSDFPNLTVKEAYRLRMQLKQNDKIYPPKMECLILGEHSYIYGIKLYVGYVDADRVLVTADDVY